MKYNRFNRPALVFDGPLPPMKIDNVDEIIIMEGSVLASTQVGSNIQEEVGTKVFHPINIANLTHVFDWLQKYFDLDDEQLPTPTPSVADGVNHFEYEEIKMVQVRDNTFIEQGVYSDASNDSFKYFRVGDDILYRSGNQYVTSNNFSTENVIEHSEYRYEFWLVSGYTDVAVEPDVWKEMIDDGSVVKLRPVIEHNTGFRRVQCDGTLGFKFQ